MKVYNLMISSGKWSCSELFLKLDDALKYVESLEDGQRKIEGDGLKFIFHYGERDSIDPPFHTRGKRVYASYALTEMTKPFKEIGIVWRVIYEQEVK